MAHTSLLRTLRRLAAEARLSARTGRSVPELRDRRLELQASSGGTFDRRRFLAGTAALGALGLLPFASRCGGSSAKDAPRIVVVGAGLAGLAAAVTLKDGGYDATVYEISKAGVGGRCISQYGTMKSGCGICHPAPSSAHDMSFDDGQVVDIYGELIDSSHETMHALAGRYGLPMVKALDFEPAGSTETYFFNDAYYSIEQATADLAAMYDQLQKDAEDAGYPTTYDTSTARGRELDNMSVYDWIEATVPGGNASNLGKLLGVAYTIEYGAELADQSALNLIYMLSSSPSDRLSVFGASDEGWRIKGGNMLLPEAMAADLGVGRRVLLGWDFQALRHESDGTYTLTFDHDGAATDVKADHVVLALPFTKLRTLDISKAGFDERKLKAINEQGGGHNGKLHLQFTKRLWNEAGPWGVSGGTSYADVGYQLAWDPTRGQPGTSGILALYNGGATADAQKIMHAFGNIESPGIQADAEAGLNQLEKVYPGLKALWNGKAVETMCHLDPRFNCSYAYWRVGQCQSFAGYERVRQGNVYFCGEHTSVDYLGFMEGAASEGIAAGEELLAALKG